MNDLIQNISDYFIVTAEIKIVLMFLAIIALIKYIFIDPICGFLFFIIKKIANSIENKREINHEL